MTSFIAHLGGRSTGQHFSAVFLHALDPKLPLKDHRLQGEKFALSGYLRQHYISAVEFRKEMYSTSLDHDSRCRSLCLMMSRARNIRRH